MIMKENRKNKELNVLRVFKNFFSSFSSTNEIYESDDIKSILASDNSFTQSEKEEILSKIDYCEKVKNEMFKENIKTVTNMNSTRILNAYKNLNSKEQKAKVNNNYFNNEKKGKSIEEK